MAPAEGTGNALDFVFPVSEDRQCADQPDSLDSSALQNEIDLLGGSWHLTTLTWVFEWSATATGEVDYTSWCEALRRRPPSNRLNPSSAPPLKGVA